METSEESGGEQTGAAPAGPIYEPVPEQARRRVLDTNAALKGAVAAVALWMMVVLLGVPNIFGLGGISLLPIAALAGAGIGVTKFSGTLIRLAAGMTVFLFLIAYTPLMEAPTD